MRVMLFGPDPIEVTELQTQEQNCIAYDPKFYGYEAVIQRFSIYNRFDKLLDEGLVVVNSSTGRMSIRRRKPAAVDKPNFEPVEQENEADDS